MSFGLSAVMLADFVLTNDAFVVRVLFDPVDMFEIDALPAVLQGFGIF